jgi:hypothetical protein
VRNKPRWLLLDRIQILKNRFPHATDVTMHDGNLIYVEPKNFRIICAVAGDNAVRMINEARRRSFD